MKVIQGKYNSAYVRRILSLGPYVMVKSPESVRNKIIDMLKLNLKQLR